MKRHNCKTCGDKLTCGNKENMDITINRHKLVCRGLRK